MTRCVESRHRSNYLEMPSFTAGDDAGQPRQALDHVSCDVESERGRKRLEMGIKTIAGAGFASRGPLAINLIQLLAGIWSTAHQMSCHNITQFQSTLICQCMLTI